MDELVQLNRQIVAALTETPSTSIENPETSALGASQGALAANALRSRFADALAVRGRRITFAEMSPENQEARRAGLIEKRASAEMGDPKVLDETAAEGAEDINTAGR
ncbi:MAG: hypothetical protein ACE5E0_05310 [Terriglobia bacterium]